MIGKRSSHRRGQFCSITAHQLSEKHAHRVLRRCDILPRKMDGALNQGCYELGPLVQQSTDEQGLYENERTRHPQHFLELKSDFAKDSPGSLEVPINQ